MPEAIDASLQRLPDERRLVAMPEELLIELFGQAYRDPSSVAWYLLLLWILRLIIAQMQLSSTSHFCDGGRDPMEVNATHIA